MSAGTYTYSCSGCCGGSSDDCCGWPETLTATFSAAGGCTCVDGLVMTLTYSAGEWTGSAVVECDTTDTWSLRLQCVTPGTCTGLRLYVDPGGCGGCDEMEMNEFDCTCDPIYYEAVRALNFCLPSCCGTLNTSFTVVITE